MNHGHVTPNPDGSLARCGGPGLCSQCSQEYAKKHGRPFSRRKPAGRTETMDFDATRWAASLWTEPCGYTIGDDGGPTEDQVSAALLRAFNAGRARGEADTWRQVASEWKPGTVERDCYMAQARRAEGNLRTLTTTGDKE